MAAVDHSLPIVLSDAYFCPIGRKSSFSAVIEGSMLIDWSRFVATAVVPLVTSTPSWINWFSEDRSAMSLSFS